MPYTRLVLLYTTIGKLTLISGVCLHQVGVPTEANIYTNFGVGPTLENLECSTQFSPQSRHVVGT